MKKIILSVLAMGLTMGLMAQKFMPTTGMDFNKDLKVVKATATTGAKSASVYYPSFIGDCAELDSPIYYTCQATGGDGQTYTFPVSGSGLFAGCGQAYALPSSMQIKGVEFYASNIYPGDVANPTVAIVDDNFNTLASGTYSTEDLSESTEAEIIFGAVTVNFAQAVSAQNFIITVDFPEYGQTSTDVLVGSTEEECTTGEPFYLNYDGVWTLADDLFQSFPAHLYIFPIVEGTVGLSEVELNSLSYVYPNPAKSEVMLASSVTVDRVEVINVLGQVVFASDVNANSIKVNTSEFATGNYIVKMYTEAGVATKKLIVE
ncbi:MAG: T9SS type A sorting domain-containing protein [Bacteroidales bacterium]|nr:T9SS type A sorting domain-containing protein [Bacteroidales bacterium]